MEIRLSKPDLQFDLHIQDIAAEYGCFAHIKRNTPYEVRFTLLAKVGSNQQADYRIQDKVIRALLVLDPEADVKTARAVYEGLNDYDKQYAARRSKEDQSNLT